MPDNAYEMMTAPSKQITSAVSNTIGQLANAYTGYQAQQAGQAASQQGAAAQYSGLESLSQATGVPMNAELTEQFKNMSSMSPQQRAVFNQSMGLEAQNMMTRYGINQAQARAAQAQQGQGMQQFGSQIDYMIAGRNQRAAPAPAPVNSGGFQISNAGIANIMGQTGTGLRFGQ